MKCLPYIVCILNKLYFWEFINIKKENSTRYLLKGLADTVSGYRINENRNVKKRKTLS
jgi:hypothetical protein